MTTKTVTRYEQERDRFVEFCNPEDDAEVKRLEEAFDTLGSAKVAQLEDALSDLFRAIQNTRTFRIFESVTIRCFNFLDRVSQRLEALLLKGRSKSKRTDGGMK